MPSARSHQLDGCTCSFSASGIDTLPRSKVKSIQLDFHVSAGSQAEENGNWKFKLFEQKGGFPPMEKASCELTGDRLLQSLKNRKDHFEHTVKMVKK